MLVALREIEPPDVKRQDGGRLFLNGLPATFKGDAGVASTSWRKR